METLVTRWTHKLQRSRACKFTNRFSSKLEKNPKADLEPDFDANLDTDLDANLDGDLDAHFYGQI